MAARGLSAALGAAIPIAALLLYNLVSTGQLIQPGYQYLYELEASFYTNLDYHLDWSIEDPRYIPQNLGIMLFNTPAILPDVFPPASATARPLCTVPGAVRGLFDPDCPLVAAARHRDEPAPDEPGLPPRDSAGPARLGPEAAS